MDKNQALKLALEALEEPREHIAKHRRLEAITAIKEALAQQSNEQAEPVAVTAEMARAFHRAISDGPLGQADEFEIQTGLEAAFAHITTPPQRKPLTDEQWQEIAAITGCLRIEKRGRDAILRVLEEAAHGIKE